MNDLVPKSPFNVYILDDDGNAIPEPDLMKWSRWFGTHDRALVCQELGNISVSTVFLGLNHQYGDGPPLLWETMVFGGEYDEYQERYSSRDDALAGHAEIVAKVRLSINS